MSLITFAAIAGTMCLLVGVPMLVAPGRTARWMIDLLEHDIHIRLFAAAYALVCVSVLVQDARLTRDLAGFMRLVAWIGLVKTLVMCWWPAALTGMTARMLMLPPIRVVYAIGCIAAGVLGWLLALCWLPAATAG